MQSPAAIVRQVVRVKKEQRHSFKFLHWPRAAAGAGPAQGALRHTQKYAAAALANAPLAAYICFHEHKQALHPH